VFADTFTELNVRVVSADRPGYGRSTPQTGRRREDWPADVAALADHLDIERFAVLGASSGGPYALACAALLPERVISVGVVCGVTDFGWTGAWNDIADSDEAALMRLADEQAAVAWCEAHYGLDGVGFIEGGGIAELALADQAALEDKTLAAAFTTTIDEAFRQGVGGYARDIAAQAKAWSFDPGTIVVPVRIVHGEADTLTPVAHARHTAEIIPTATLVTLPDHGHISILTQLPQLATELVLTMRSRRQCVASELAAHRGWPASQPITDRPRHLEW
jgi:pimeloyl-ACP methyl ester carboxylesterase